MKKTDLTNLEPLLKVQAEHCALQTQIDRIDQAIADQQTIIEASDIDDTRLAELRAERELILANIATGEAEQADLTKIDAELETEAEAVQRSSKAASDAAKNARQTITGLERKRAALEQQQNALERDRQQARRALFTELAEIKAREYYDRVSAVAGSLATLRAIQIILDQEEPPVRTIVMSENALMGAELPKAGNLPEDETPANSGAMPRNWRALNADTQAFGNVIREQANSLTEELRRLGVEV